MEKRISKKRIGALTIGQSPRPDLVDPLAQMLPECEILEAGALDEVVPEEIPNLSDAAYPLVTRMQSGAAVMVSESYIAPKLQQALERLEAKGVAATILLCAGTFAGLRGAQPLFKPFNVGCGILRALNMKSIGLIVPVAGQEAPIRRRWEAAGWETTVWTADLGTLDEAFQWELNERVEVTRLDCIVLDYVGHPFEHVERLQSLLKLPVIDLGYLAMVTLAASV